MCNGVMPNKNDTKNLTKYAQDTMTTETNTALYTTSFCTHERPEIKPLHFCYTNLIILLRSNQYHFISEAHQLTLFITKGK